MRTSRDGEGVGRHAVRRRDRRAGAGRRTGIARGWAQDAAWYRSPSALHASRRSRTRDSVALAVSIAPCASEREVRPVGEEVAVVSGPQRTTGWPMRSSTRSTRSRSPTRTVTASGTCPGVLAHLDHLAWLGVDTIWFNPCFASPFVDAGYDVADYLHGRAALRHERRPASRWSTRHGDAGSGCCSTSSPGTPPSSTHGSRPSCTPPGRDPDGDRYIWSDRVGSERCRARGRTRRRRAVGRCAGPRGGFYLKNFYDAQPALNFGFARLRERRAVAAAGRRAGPAPQPPGAARHHVVLDRPRRRRVPRRHGALARQGRPWSRSRPWRCGASCAPGSTRRTPAR